MKEWQAKNKANNKRPGNNRERNDLGSKWQRREISSSISNNEASFKAIFESQLTMTVALTFFTTGGQAAHVGRTIVAPPAMEPRVAFDTDPQATTREEQAKLLNAAQVATVKLQGIIKKKAEWS